MKKIFFSLVIYLLTINSVYAEYLMSGIALVGISQSEVKARAPMILEGKSVLELSSQSNWYDTVKNSGAQEIIIKQPSGFVGLYTPSGLLVKSLDLPANYPQDPNDTYSPPPQIASPISSIRYKNYDEIGYMSGGRRDPYTTRRGDRPGTAWGRNYDSKLSPGWGYGQTQDRNTKGSAVLNFFKFVPLDTVTPFNYPGTFDSVGLPTAYFLGALPHIGGLATDIKQASNDREAYIGLSQNTPPAYSEMPVQYYNQAEPDNPFTPDPNLYRMTPMPEAFTQKYPNYDQQSYYYYQNGVPSPNGKKFGN